MAAAVLPAFYGVPITGRLPGRGVKRCGAGVAGRAERFNEALHARKTAGGRFARTKMTFWAACYGLFQKRFEKGNKILIFLKILPFSLGSNEYSVLS